MSNLIPNNNAESVEAELSQSPFRSVEAFIEAYNAGMVNARNETISGYAEQVAGAFDNIEIKNRKLTILSKSENSFRSVEAIVNDWGIIINAMRDVQKIVDSGYDADSVYLGNDNHYESLKNGEFSEVLAKSTNASGKVASALERQAPSVISLYVRPEKSSSGADDSEGYFDNESDDVEPVEDAVDAPSEADPEEYYEINVNGLLSLDVSVFNEVEELLKS